MSYMWLLEGHHHQFKEGVYGGPCTLCGMTVPEITLEEEMDKQHSVEVEDQSPQQSLQGNLEEVLEAVDAQGKLDELLAVLENTLIELMKVEGKLKESQEEVRMLRRKQGGTYAH